jgi:hypothetical protein
MNDPRKDLDEDLIRADKRLGIAIVIVAVLAYVLAFVFADTGSPAAEVFRRLIGV